MSAARSLACADTTASALDRTLLVHLAAPSVRRREVLALVAEGLSRGQIATKRHIGAGTVESDRAVVMMKLGFTSMGELVEFAVRAGLMDRGPVS